MKLTPRRFLIGATLFILLLRSGSGCAQSIEELVLKGSYRDAIQKYADKNLTPAENYLLGLCYREAGETRKAESIWQTLLAGSEKERSLLALAHLKSKDGALTDSEKIFRQFLAEFPKSQYQPSALLGLAEILPRKNKEEKLKILNRLRRRYPFSSEAEEATRLLNQESGPYTIQIYSFTDLSRAERIAGNLSSKGYEAYVARIFNGSVSYKVRIGNFKNEKTAKNAGQTLKNNTGLDYFIVRLRVTKK